MTGNPYLTISVAGTTLISLMATSAQAQMQPSYTTPGQMPGSVCQCWQQVVQPIIKSVPVTEYQQFKQTVERPVVDTHYEDETYTAYRPITEMRTAEIPTMTYQNVTEYQTVQRDAGQWITQRQPIYKPNPWEYDNRCSLLGWLNRSGYAVRSAFMPNQTTQRMYAPAVVEQTVPVTRQVAIPSSRTVQYQVTNLQAFTETRKVARNTVRMVTQEITSMRPVTVMRQVPVGSRVAYAPLVPGGTTTVMQPRPDNISSARAPEPTPARTTEREADKGYFDSGDQQGNSSPFKKTSMPMIPDYLQPEEIRVDRPSEAIPTVASTSPAPTVVHVGRWVARRSVATQNPESASTVSVAGLTR